MRLFNSLIISSATVALSALLSPCAYAQNTMDEFSALLNQSYDEFAKQARQEYADFRDKVNQEYADFMRAHPWTPTKIEKPVPAPVYKEPAPDVTPEEDEEQEQSAPVPMPAPKPVVIETVIPIDAPLPQPQPISPIHEVPVVIEEGNPLQVIFYGTPINLRPTDSLDDFQLNGANEDAFATGWEELSKSSTNNLIADCLRVRSDYNLPDWGYVKFLDAVASAIKGNTGNEKVLLQGFLLNQSGYKVRFAYDGEKKLHLLFATRGIMYDHSRYHVDDDWFYSYTKPQGTEVYICKFGMPKEQAVSMGIEKSPILAYTPGTRRDVTAKRYPEIKVSVTPNKNLIDFYNEYPDATLEMSPYSLWVIHGNTPASPEVKEQLYPALRKAIEGKTQLEGVQMLLKLAQSFPYEYDETIWGTDRTFWMDESWEYPYSDCEDHSINFTRMIRDILGLDVCLIYYPGHLSSCVAITEGDVKGDYIDFGGKRYTVCDPTYFYGGVGRTAPSNDNSEAILIPLRLDPEMIPVKTKSL